MLSWSIARKGVVLGFASKGISVAALVGGLLLATLHAACGDLSLLTTGDVLGSVVDTRGIPQMGATVQLYNKFERLIGRANTGRDGRFAFAGLPADLYSVRVSLASFLPVARDRIMVKPGLDSMLQIHLATLLSSVEVSYAVPTAAMSDDWKWVLRSSPATRPMSRFLPRDVSISQSAQPFPRIFSETRAMLSLTGGDSNLVDSDSAQADLGTGFALATNVLGKNQIRLGGNYAQSTLLGPSALGLVAIYTRDSDGTSGTTPEIALAVSQFGVVTGPGTSSTSLLEGSLPAVRAMSLSVYQTTDPTDNVHLEYGMTAESVDYLQHSNRISPFARLTFSAGSLGKMIASYSDGGRPDQLSAHQAHATTANLDSRGDDLAQVAGSLARMPQLAYGNHRLELQRTQSFEVGYGKTAQSRTYAVSAFYENVSNGRINVAGDTSGLDDGNLLSDGVSKTLIYDIGRYKRSGLVGSVSQGLGESLEVAVAYGRMGGFSPDQNIDSFGNQGNFLAQHRHSIASVNLDAKIPKAGTKILANYGWMDEKALIPTHVFTTQSTYLAPGVNVLVRQPLPTLFGMPGHFEITADVRNLLAQGYLPVSTGADGHTMLAVQCPRAIRGGLNFIF